MTIHQMQCLIPLETLESSMPNAAEASEVKKAKNVPKPRNRKKTKAKTLQLTLDYTQLENYHF